MNSYANFYDMDAVQIPESISPFLSRRRMLFFSPPVFRLRSAPSRIGSA
jgi:hypothetical protein